MDCSCWRMLFPPEMEARGTPGGSQLALALVGISLTAPCSPRGPPRHQHPLKCASSANTTLSTARGPQEHPLAQLSSLFATSKPSGGA